MKNKLYYVLFLLYAAMVVFVLYINDAFTPGVTMNVNLLINVGFLLLIGILFMISTVSFNRLNRCTKEMTDFVEQMQEEYKKNGGKNLWQQYHDRKDLFACNELKKAFGKYQARMKANRGRHGYSDSCDIEEYVNEDMIDKVGMTYFNSGMSGTLTGLGILGTFLGLSMGFNSFSGEDVYTISDNVGQLLSGMKVAFHTSVYGIFFSLVFNFVYRSIMSDAYEKLENFQKAFKQFAMPRVATNDENGAAMALYQANMANTLKQILDLMKGNAMEQTAGVERIVNQVMEQLDGMMGVNFGKLGQTMQSTAEAQAVYANNCRDLIESANALVEMNRKMQEALDASREQQELFAKELVSQKEQLSKACDEMCDDISNQLFALGQVRGLYE